MATATLINGRRQIAQFVCAHTRDGINRPVPLGSNTQRLKHAACRFRRNGPRLVSARQVATTCGSRPASVVAPHPASARRSGRLYRIQGSDLNRKVLGTLPGPIPSHLTRWRSAISSNPPPFVMLLSPRSGPRKCQTENNPSNSFNMARFRRGEALSALYSRHQPAQLSAKGRTLLVRNILTTYTVKTRFETSAPDPLRQLGCGHRASCRLARPGSGPLLVRSPACRR